MGERDFSSKQVSPLGLMAPPPRVSPSCALATNTRLAIPRPRQLETASDQPDLVNQQALEDQNVVAGAVVAGAGEAEVQEQAYDFSNVLSAIPSWLISLVVHVAILLILAVCTLRIDDVSHDQIVVEISDSPVEMTTTMMDFSLEPTELEDLSRPLEPAAEEAIEFEEVMLAPETADTSETLLIPDELPPIDLPEFRTAAEKTARLNPNSSTDSKDGVNASSAANSSGDSDSKYGKFFGTKAYGSKFVFVIDGSSSMMNARWLRATRELISTVNELDENQEFLVLVYNTSTRVMFGMRTDNAALVPATAENLRRTKYWLGNQRPRGGTLPAQTMRLALSLKPDAIYFLSDGELADDTMFLLRNWNSPKKDANGLFRQIPIHTILLGSQFGFLTMKTIADQNNGIFTAVQ